MNYRYETIMSWIMYVKNGIWEIDKRNNYSSDGEFVAAKFNALFKIELERECHDSFHFMANPYKNFGSITVFINPVEQRFTVLDGYNNLEAFYEGIYGNFDGWMICLDTKARGFKSEYFSFRPEESDRFVSLKSIVEGKAKKCPNVRRVISMLFARQWPYLESINQEDYAFMDYEGEEKEELIKECKKCEP